ncbi:MAG: ROK family protein [Chloroflexota bacterium]
MSGLVGTVDIGATKTLVAVRLLPLAGWAHDGATIRFPTPATPEGLVDALEGSFRTLATAAGGRIIAVGVGTPGPVDAARGIVVHAPNQGWRDVPLGPLLAERLGVPVALDDDANAGALGEAAFGAGTGTDPVAYVTVSSGIGAGMVVGGRIVGGAHGAAGEVGHLVIDAAGPRCGCGSRGCVEAYASGTGLERRARETWPRGRGPDGGPAPRTAAEVFRAARTGDADAVRLVEDGAAALARAFAAIVVTLDPERLVVGGAIGLAQPRYVSRAAGLARRLTIAESRSRSTVALAALRGESVLAGAAALGAGTAQAAETPGAGIARTTATPGRPG